MPPRELTALRSYGKSFAESEPSGRARLRMLLRAVNALRRELGAMTLARILWRSKRLAREVDQDALAGIRRQGLNDEGFLKARVEELSLAAAVVERVGPERATAAYRKMLEKVSDDYLRAVVPTAEELGAFDDPFATFSAYLRGVIDANDAAGIHRSTVRQDTDDVFAYDVTYCAYERVAAALGDPRLCHLSTCVGDEITFPKLCGGIGARFVRQSTLAAGAHCCDFRFERC